MTTCHQPARVLRAVWDPCTHHLLVPPPTVHSGEPKDMQPLTTIGHRAGRAREIQVSHVKATRATSSGASSERLLSTHDR